MHTPYNPFRIAILIPLVIGTAALSHAWKTTNPYFWHFYGRTRNLLEPYFWVLVNYTKDLLSYYFWYVADHAKDLAGYCLQFVADCAREYALRAYNNPNTPFIALFIFRYLRLIVHLFSFWYLYSPSQQMVSPKYDRGDCTIILPTIDPENEDFDGCVHSCLDNIPGHLLIVTVGQERVAACNRVIAPYLNSHPGTIIEVLNCPVANKRRQVAYGLAHVTTAITILLDDHVFWPSIFFLPEILAPFEDDNVGGVGTNKRVRRTETGFGMRSFWNMIGALYLERHNFEIRATNAIDGGVFVISGRTAAYRTPILQDPAFLHGYLNEMFFLGLFGPLNADDDNYITRWLVSHGYDIKIQYSQNAMIETTLGTYPRFMSQCLRWARTTWRSNTASLFTDRTVWRRQIWCVYAVYFTSFVNFALFYDAALLYTLTLSPYGDRNALKMLAYWIFFTKLIKLVPYFLRRPQDLLMLPGYFLFAYYHSLIKLYAGLTFYRTNWGGRNLNNANVDDDHDSPDDGPIDNSGYGPLDGESNDSRGTSDHDPSSDSSDSDSGSQPPRGAATSQWRVNSSSDKVVRYGMSKPKVRFALPKTQIPTPWGSVSPADHHTKPANVLEKDYQDYGTRGSISTSSSTSKRKDHKKSYIPTEVIKKGTLIPPMAYQRSWARGIDCNRLHYDNLQFASSASKRCMVPDPFDRPPTHVVKSRPRF